MEDWLGGLRGGRVYLRTPKRGVKQQLLDLVIKNAQVVLDETKSRQAFKEKAQERPCRNCRKWPVCLSLQSVSGL